MNSVWHYDVARCKPQHATRSPLLYVLMSNDKM